MSSNSELLRFNKPKKPKSPSPPPDRHSLNPTRLLSSSSSLGPTKSSLLKQALAAAAAAFLLLLLYALLSSFLSPSSALPSSFSDAFIPSSASSSVKVYLYDLPTRFTYGVIHHHSLARASRASSVVMTSLKYPGHQHMGEWYLFADLLKPDSDRVGSPIARVSDPDQADLFYVPFFSSLSLIVNTNRQACGESPAIYSDEENQAALVTWLEAQPYWKRNNGRDHVIMASDPNALYRVLDAVKNAVLLVCDFGRLRPDQGSLVKDVVVPYSHRINAYNGDVGVENRKTLLFFMGNRYRKEGGKIRDFLFQLLENEVDVVVKHGTQSRENRRAATHGMHMSKFCLNPAGDTPSACRLFDSIVSLCVPVIVSDSIELPFEDVVDYRKIAIFVESNTALRPGFLVSMLREISSERILEYQRELNEVKHYFQYGVPNGSVNEIWRQVAQKLPLIKLSINREKRLVKRDLSAPDCSCVCSNQTGIITSL